MRLSFFLYSIVLLSIINYSCQSPEVVTIPTVQPRIVVNFIGNNNKPLSGKIGVSRGVLDYYSSITPANATVMIYEDGQLKETLTLQKIMVMLAMFFIPEIQFLYQEKLTPLKSNPPLTTQYPLSTLNLCRSKLTVLI